MIHPIEFRYGTDECRKIWSREETLRKYLQVEVAIARAEAELGIIPREAAEAISRGAEDVRVERVDELERETRHDVMAVVRALAERCGKYGEYVHFGATSYDIVDTARALQMKETLDLVEGKLLKLRDLLVKKAEEHKHTVCAARTHGQIAIPTTYGMRFALWADEIDRHIRRIREARPRILVGKVAGAVGTQASIGERGLEVERRAMEILGLRAASISNQVVQRDLHAEYVFILANIATTLDKICTEIRILQRTEIGEVEEYFAPDQVGSSTMPHKRNPVNSEQVCGLARAIRGYVEPALLNNTLWDERDLTNSSCERIILPEVSILTDHILKVTTNVIEKLRIKHDRIRQNLELMKGLNMSEAVMMELAKKIGRQKAHEILRRCCMKALDRGIHLRDVLLEEKEITDNLSREEIERLLDPNNYLGTAVRRVEEIVERLGKNP